MKHKTISFFAFLLSVTLLVCCLFSCGGGKASATVAESGEELLVIQVEETDGKATLLDVMKALREGGDISFECDESGFVLSISGKSGESVGANSGKYWSLYVSDERYALDGEFIWGEKVCYLAAEGARTMKVKAGHYYLWSYELMTW